MKDSRVEKRDQKVLAYLNKLQSEGVEFVRVGAIAKKLGMDSVKALGSVERVKGKIVKAPRATDPLVPRAAVPLPDESVHRVGYVPVASASVFVRAKETIKRAFMDDPCFRQTYVDNVACYLMDNIPSLRGLKKTGDRLTRDHLASEIIRIVCE